MTEPGARLGSSGADGPAPRRDSGGTARTPAGDIEVRHEPDGQRYVGYRDGREVGLIGYRRDGDVVVVLHTETSPALRGQGIAAALTQGMLRDLEDDGLRVRPVCPYTVDYLHRHPEYAHLRA